MRRIRPRGFKLRLQSGSLFVNELYRRLWSTRLEEACKDEASARGEDGDSSDESISTSTTNSNTNAASSSRVSPFEYHLFGSTEKSAAELRVCGLPLWQAVVRGRLKKADWLDLLIDLFYIHEALTGHVEESFGHPLWGATMKKFEPVLSRVVCIGQTLEAELGSTWRSEIWPTTSCVRLVERFREVSARKTDLLFVHWVFAHLSMLLASPYFFSLLEPEVNTFVSDKKKSEHNASSPCIAALDYPDLGKLSVFKSKKSFTKLLLSTIDGMSHYINEGDRLQRWFSEMDLALDLWCDVLAEVKLDLSDAGGDERVVQRCLQVYKMTRTGPYQANRIHQELKTHSQPPPRNDATSSSATITREDAQPSNQQQSRKPDQDLAQSLYKRRRGFVTLDELEMQQEEEDRDRQVLEERRESYRRLRAHRSSRLMYVLFAIMIAMIVFVMLIPAYLATRSRRRVPTLD